MNFNLAILIIICDLLVQLIYRDSILKKIASVATDHVTTLK